MSNSDEEVLNATLSALKIFDAAKCKSKKITHNSETDHNKFESNPSLDSKLLTIDSLTASEQSSSLPTDYEKMLRSMSAKGCPQYHNTLEGLEVINMMYDFYHKKKAEKKDEVLKSTIKEFEDVISPSEIQAKVDAISNLLEHMKRITESKAKLKQNLRSSVMNDFWKIRAEYHRNVVNFFNLAKELMNDVAEFLEAVEESKKHNPKKSKNLLLLVTRLYAEMHENIEIISEFRKYIQSFTS